MGFDIFEEERQKKIDSWEFLCFNYKHAKSLGVDNEGLLKVLRRDRIISKMKEEIVEEEPYKEKYKKIDRMNKEYIEQKRMKGLII